MKIEWRDLLSWRGRVDRTTFWTVQFLMAIASACGKATVALFPVMPLVFLVVLISIAFGVIGIFNLARRLHDLGRSGWWMLPPFAMAILMVAGAAAKMGRGSNGAIASEDVALLVPAVFIIAVGLIRGQPRSNRFGDPPAGPPPLAA